MQATPLQITMRAKLQAGRILTPKPPHVSHELGPGSAMLRFFPAHNTRSAHF